MENLNESILVALLLAAMAGYWLGRAQGGFGGNEHERHLENERIEQALNSAQPSKLEEIERLLADNKKISAIKILRAETGLGLKEAKIAVERYAARKGMAGAV